VQVTKTTRRRFLFGAILAAPWLAYGDAKFVEPTWVKLRRVRLAKSKPAHRFVHFTDVHHKGDRAYLVSVVNKINALSPEFVCFTGDIIEEKKYLSEALEIMGGIKSPVYGVPGNHDYWSKVDFGDIGKAFERTGGRWLMDEQLVTSNGEISLLGATCSSLKHFSLRTEPRTRNILLMHYPAWVKKLGSTSYDLILAGHSHGGQVRLPFYGAVYVPFGVEEYDMGLFHTSRGPLYVNPGIGWFPFPIRFNCRPEITVFEI
jgi:predicted MPP superfamily phosphohydrolase